MIGIESALFGGLEEGRQCGGCVECCRTLKISTPELTKPADVLCQHCDGAGCRIYLTRPNVCRNWYCLWRYIGELPDELRPDRCGVLIDLDRHFPPRNIFEHVYIVLRADDAKKFDQPAVAQAIDMFIRQGALPVWLSVDGTKKMIYPAEPLAKSIYDFSKNEPVPPEMLKQVGAWLKPYLKLAEAVLPRVATTEGAAGD